ncbi:MAG: UDP-glucose 4-epimerase GalE [bacterium]|nr:UDP-glucose 4-epimerase GalE [bacterium]
MSTTDTILVVGGAGYIGSVVAAALCDKGYPVVVFDNFEKGHRQAIHPDAHAFEGDLRRMEDVECAFTEHAIGAVMHFGAYSLVGESVEQPGKYFDNNVEGGHNLLKMMQRRGVKRIVFSSTAAVYGNPLSVPITEDSVKIPINAYGRSKLAFEYLLKSYEEAYGINHAILRYFNAAGATESLGEDHTPETHLIPIILDVAQGKRESIAMYGTDYDTPDGTCVRDYIHVSDLADAHLLALEHIHQESIVCNLGNGQGFSVREVIEAARRATGHPIPAKEAPRRPGDPGVLTASSDRARQTLGWTPRIPELGDIIASAWAWRQRHPNGYES